MVELIRSATFDAWLTGLRDAQTRARTLTRLDRLATGNPGDVKPIGEGLSEMRIDFGSGYRVYFMRRGSLVIVLLCGGDKASQPRDIKLARRIAADWKD
ncbi:type II toxin-antitoxin system RelE/ParE family toxin [Sinimarinibacterium flocculans]|uniref:Putative addiction module killer protein n=1 Tax=Sinimarinibacterium flocculans TaxID=985250 RepID=A0A318E1D7_9GAMM|nr:type II toxin-antitoxin system RelE/ParE family toxin [Sinimarinibacterium flocculans]PXV64639.1 putative addiction module killer protein [Sinimarinibacterium flocculans]